MRPTRGAHGNGLLSQLYTVVTKHYQAAFVQVAYRLLVVFLAYIELRINVLGRALVR